MSYTLLILNIIISPTLMFFRKSFKEGRARYFMYLFDSNLDTFYLFNNIFQGGEEDKKPSINAFVNLALWYPAYSIILKMRSVRRAIAVQQEKKFDTRSTRSIKRALTRHSDKIKDRGNNKCLFVNCSMIIEKSVLIFIFLFGSSIMIYHLLNFIMKYYECRNELTPQLWDNAFPLKLYMLGGLWNISCGYEFIQNISAANRDIHMIPKTIAKCTALRNLTLSHNRLVTLPCELLEMKDISHANLTGNPVASELDVQHCKLKVTTFPTIEFVCRHMSQTLRVLNFPNQSAVTKIDRCIDSIKNLEKLLLPYNNLTADGIPSNILNFEFSKLKEIEIDITGNDIILNEFSWENENIHINTDNKDFDRFKKMVYFLSKYFQSVKKLNLRGNQIRDEYIIYDLLDNMTSLEHLDVSNNKITDIFERDKFLRNATEAFISFDLWPSLKMLDLSSNPLSSITWVEFCVFFETRNIFLNITNNDIKKLQWHKSKRIYKEVKERKYFQPGFNVSKSLYHFPQSIVRQMGNLDAFYVRDFENLLFTTNDLLFICRFNRLKILNILNVHFYIQDIPNACRKITGFYLKNEKHAYAIMNYTWPAFWSEESIIEEISISVGAINISQIQRPINSSKLRTITFVDYKAKFPILGLPAFFFDGSLPTLQNFLCDNCYFTNGGVIFPRVTNASKLRQLKFDYLSTDIAHVGTLDDSLLQGKELRILELRSSGMTGDINLSPKFVYPLLCLDIELSAKFNPLKTTELFNVQGELWLPRTVANLDKLLENATSNITVTEEWKDGIKYTTTFWRVNNMICDDHNQQSPTVYCSAIKEGSNTTVGYESFCGQDLYIIDLYLTNGIF